MDPHRDPPGGDPEELAATLEALASDVQVGLIATAYGPPAEPDEDDPLALSAELGLRAPRTAHTSLFDALKAGAAARRLEAAGVDWGVFVWVELARVEAAGVGPAAGLAEALRELRNRIEAQDALPVRTRIHRLLATSGPSLPKALARRLFTVHAACVDIAPVDLRRLAAADDGAGRFVSDPVPVRGAPRWWIRVRAEPTLDGAFMITVERSELAGAGDEAAPPPIRVFIGSSTDEPDVAITRRLAGEQETLSWYQPALPAGKLVVWAVSE